MHQKRFITAGKAVGEADKALIMIHGRGAAAEDIISLTSQLDLPEYAFIAPQATNYSWYPYSFLVNPEKNEPWLSSALLTINQVVIDTVSHGIAKENIYFLGFSQGACLALEYSCRYATKWGGIVAFTGGLIGDRIYSEKYQGDFFNTPVFIGTSDPDPHVPVDRVIESAGIIRKMNAAVTLEVYSHIGHTIIHDEIEKAKKLVFGA